MAMDVDLILTKAAGIVGATLSMAFAKGSAAQRIVMAIGGSAMSYYVAPYASTRLELPEGLTGFFLGVFGMAICFKAWETIQAMPVAELAQAMVDAIKKRFL